MNLGYCHLRGRGVPAGKGKTLQLFRLALEQGEQKAADQLARLGEPTEDPEVNVRRGILRPCV